jgi:hypothetical protein
MIDYQNSGYLQDPDSFYRKRPARETASHPREGTRDAALRISGADGHDTARQAEDLCEGDRRGVEHRRDPRERADPARTTDMSPVEHLAQYIGTTTEAVLENIPNAVLQALCSVPQYTRLRRVHDATILGNLRTLVDAMPADDLRRPRLRFLLEDAERRSRM